MVGRLSRDDRRTLEESVAAAERKTAAEIVLFITRRAQGYRLIEWTIALLLALAAPALLLPFGSPLASTLWALQLIVFMVTALLLMRINLGRKLAGPRGQQRAVRDAAERQFFAHGLRRTKDRAAVLLYVSLRDHRVEIIADDEAAPMLTQEQWDRLARTIAEEARAGHLVRGLTEAIDALGQTLGDGLPPDRDNPDELPNLIEER